MVFVAQHTPAKNNGPIRPLSSLSPSSFIDSRADFAALEIFLVEFHRNTELHQLTEQVRKQRCARSLAFTLTARHPKVCFCATYRMLLSLSETIEAADGEHLIIFWIRCTYSSHLDPTYFMDYLHVLWIVKLQERPGGHSLLLVIDFVMRSKPIKETWLFCVVICLFSHGRRQGAPFALITNRFQVW